MGNNISYIPVKNKDYSYLSNYTSKLHFCSKSTLFLSQKKMLNGDKIKKIHTKESQIEKRGKVSCLKKLIINS
jgi:hypothetical protein